MNGGKPTFYDRLSQWYDVIALGSEWSLIQSCCDELQVQPDESVLEIGHGTGHALAYLAGTISQDGLLVGMDKSAAMTTRARKLSVHSGVAEKVHFVRGSACELPFTDNFFNAILITFTLELFSDANIPQVLAECYRVMQPGGRLGVVSLHSLAPVNRMTRSYIWLHEKFPSILDCRPIEVEESLSTAGFQKTNAEQSAIWGLGVISVLARKP